MIMGKNNNMARHACIIRINEVYLHNDIYQ